MNNLVGKTIESVNTQVADNIIVLNFTDGTSIVIDTEPISMGLYRPCFMDIEQYQDEQDMIEKNNREMLSGGYLTGLL